MKIGLFGHGKMGTCVATCAEKRGLSLVEPSQADVCIDFSHPSVVLNHVKWALTHQKPLVIGTTGWERDLKSAQDLINNSPIATLAASNFSLGMALFTHLLVISQKLFKNYDLAGVEYHHQDKKDAPSGTALHIAQRLGMEKDFSSVRCGRFTGKHEVIFDSPCDTVTLIHEAHNRESFALGAIEAAQWLLGKRGWYTLDDMLRDLYSAHYPF